eukprot:1556671-Alexandrium_andersonii.AAC.1
MSASLVGSEMCIRDRQNSSPNQAPLLGRWWPLCPAEELWKCPLLGPAMCHAMAAMVSHVPSRIEIVRR